MNSSVTATPHSFAKRSANGRLGSYLSVSTALIVCRDTPSRRASSPWLQPRASRIAFKRFSNVSPACKEYFTGRGKACQELFTGGLSKLQRSQLSSGSRQRRDIRKDQTKRMDVHRARVDDTYPACQRPSRAAGKKLPASIRLPQTPQPGPGPRTNYGVCASLPLRSMSQCTTKRRARKGCVAQTDTNDSLSFVENFRDRTLESLQREG